MNKPNVIFVLTDDQGYGDLACHGNPIIKTPNLDALHDESIRFTDFHVAPMCTPTRGELLTGQDALRNGATFVCMGRSLMNPELPTLADIFAMNGYRTGHFGKWHLGDNYPYRPQDRGFHETIHHPAWGITSAADYFGNDYFDDHYRHNGTIEAFEGYCTDVWFDEAMDWIEEQDDAPFFAYIATNAPHTPLWVPDEYRQPYLDHVAYNVASFYGMIANIDDNMGKLDAFLHKTGLRDNTILIFMTDNGTANGETVYNAGMRGKKTTLYEGGHRVPFFIRWPEGQLGEPRDIPDPTHGTDVLPTLISLCDLDESRRTLTMMASLSPASCANGKNWKTGCSSYNTATMSQRGIEPRARAMPQSYGIDGVSWMIPNCITSTATPRKNTTSPTNTPMSYKRCGRITMRGGMNLAQISIFTTPFPSGQKRKSPRDCPVAIGWASIATIPMACADV